MIVSAGSPAPARAWLISVSTCAAGVPPWAGGGLAGAVVAEGRGLDVLVAGAAGRDDGEPGDADGDAGLVAAWLGGIVTTVGDAARPRPPDIPGQGLAATAPQAAVVRELTAVCPEGGPGKNTVSVK